MSQGNSFGKFPKRKHLISPKNTFRSKKKTSPATPKLEHKQTLLNYFSPSPDSKKVRLTPDDTVACNSEGNILSTPKTLSVRKDLFYSKFDNDKKEVITISDDEDDISTFDLHFDRGKRKEIIKEEDVKLENNLKDEDLCNQTFVRLLDDLDNIPLSNSDNVSNSLNNNGRFKLSNFSTVSEELKTDIKPNIQQLSSDQLDSKTQALNDELELMRDIPDSTLDSVKEIIIVSPRKSPNKSKENAASFAISPIKSIEDVASLVSDVDWWDESGDPPHLAKVLCKSNLNNNSFTQKTSDSNESDDKTSKHITLNTDQNSTKDNNVNTKNVNDGLNSTIKTSSGDDKIDKTSSTTSDFTLDCDLIHYITTSPPACIAWETIFVHSQHQNIKKKYHSLCKEDKILYSKLFQRKYDWIRLSNMKYNFISDINISLNHLVSIGFIKFFNSEAEDLSMALNLMQVDDLKKVCDVLKLNKKGKKNDMVDNILKETRRQPLLKFGNTTPGNQIKKKIANFLPKLIKLEEEPRKLFMSFLLISTYAQYKSRDDNRMHIVLDLLFKLKDGKLRDLGLPLTPVPIFKSLATFEEYEKSVNLVDQLIEAKKEKKWDEAKELILSAKTELMLYLGNAQNILDLEEMPDHLRKYTSGANYVYALSEGIEVLKKFKDTASTGEAIECITLLLSQFYFRKGQRPNWNCELALLLERWKKYDELFLALKLALEENSLTPLGKFVLAQRCEMLIKKKRGLSVPQKNELALLSDIPPYRYSTNSIQAKAMPNVSTNKKQMWSIETNDGHQYTGVEEIVRQHYMSSEGGSYSDGCHDEGRILITLALCAFWSVIYEPLEGMFHVRLQSRPLDWGSSAFYRNRVELIQAQIANFQLAGIDGLMNVITDVCAKCSGTLSVISWELIQPERLPEIKTFLECLGVEPFLKFCDYLLQSYKERSSGLPDLTLWNVNNSKCLFVEVKGPSDKLSHKQKIWLQKFNEFGINAEVCHVHTLHTGKRDISNADME